MKEDYQEKLDYTVIETMFLTTLIPLVKDYIKNGWEPQGGICYNTDDNIYLQAMIKKEWYGGDLNET